MSQNLQHYQALNRIVTNALLALYCTMSLKGGFWTIKKRNEFLVKYIKPNVKKNQFSVCKHEIKSMLNIGRSTIGDLEKRLWAVNVLHLEAKAKFSHSDELYIMLNELFEQCQFIAMIENNSKLMDEDVLYMTEKECTEGFDEDNNQTKPLRMKIKTHRLNALIKAVQASGIYHIEVENVDEHEVTHLFLHRKE